MGRACWLTSSVADGPRFWQISTKVMSDLGKALVVMGLLSVAIGLLLWSGAGKGWFGHLPGDIHYSRDGFRLHFPIVTCLVVSIVLTLLLWLLRR